MTQAELTEILKQHKLWLDSNGEEGKKADLTGADLSNIDLCYDSLSDVNLSYADLEAAGLHLFVGTRHDCIYNSKDDKIYIGCEAHSLEYWLANYVVIGKVHGYTDDDIEEYGKALRSLV